MTKSAEKGISLIEITIAIMLSSLVLGGFSAALFGTLNTFSREAETSNLRQDVRQQLLTFKRTIETAERAQVFGEDEKIHLNAENKFEGTKMRLELKTPEGNKVVKYRVTSTAFYRDGEKLMDLEQGTTIPFKQTADRCIEVDITYKSGKRTERLQIPVYRNPWYEPQKYTTWENYQATHP